MMQLLKSLLTAASDGMYLSTVASRTYANEAEMREALLLALRETTSEEAPVIEEIVEVSEVAEEEREPVAA